VPAIVLVSACSSPTATTAEDPPASAQSDEASEPSLESTDGRRVPFVEGRTVRQARRTLRRLGFEVAVRTSRSILAELARPGTVVEQRPAPFVRLRAGRRVTLFVAPQPVLVEAPPGDCTPGYDPCLAPAPDYDCIGGTGDGPEYTGTVRVTGADIYDLDRDGDGIGCDS
jgi:hypothetical protein